MSERLLCAKEVAAWAGVSPATVQDWVEAKTIPAYKIGGRLRFRVSELEEWLEASRVGADPPGGCGKPEAVQ